MTPEQAIARSKRIEASNPRYTKRDWELLEKAEKLIEEFKEAKHGDRKT